MQYRIKSIVLAFCSVVFSMNFVCCGAPVNQEQKKLWKAREFADQLCKSVDLSQLEAIVAGKVRLLEMADQAGVLLWFDLFSESVVTDIDSCYLNGGTDDVVKSEAHRFADRFLLVIGSQFSLQFIQDFLLLYRAYLWLLSKEVGLHFALIDAFPSRIKMLFFQETSFLLKHYSEIGEEALFSVLNKLNYRMESLGLGGLPLDLPVFE